MAQTLMQHAATRPGQRREIVDLGPWFHNLHLPDGSQTAPNHPLGDFPAFKWQQLQAHLPRDLTGWSALDIGCNAGFYSFELARMGALVTGIDVDDRFLAQASWARGEFGLEDRVRFCKSTVYDLTHTDSAYDLILFMGVFYHLRYPLLGLDIVAEKVRRLMVFQTLTMPGNGVYRNTGDREIDEREAFHLRGWPKMAFIENRFAGDETNWWFPNHAGVEAMLRSTGMRVVARPGHEIYLCEPDQAARRMEWDRAELRAATGTGRRAYA
jgi:tRNA (mo5U34)-methyltransferase